MYCDAVAQNTSLFFTVFLSFFLYNAQYMVLFFQFSGYKVLYLKGLL